MTGANNARRDDNRRNDNRRDDQRNRGVRSSVNQSPNATNAAGAANRQPIAFIVALVVIAVIITLLAIVQSHAAVSRHEGYRTAQAQTAQASEPEPSNGSASAQSSDAASDAASGTASNAAAGASASADGSASASAQSVDWQDATGGAYPDVSQVQDLNVQVSLADQRVYIKDGDTTLYTMICSSGMDDTTPHGTFTVQSRGENFFNPTEQMGANWWVSFQGDYLFHTVPTDANGDYIVSECEKLGRPASHGCVRLSVSDAKWIYDNVPDGTTVVIA